MGAIFGHLLVTQVSVVVLVLAEFKLRRDTVSHDDLEILLAPVCPVFNITKPHWATEGDAKYRWGRRLFEVSYHSLIRASEGDSNA